MSIYVLPLKGPNNYLYIKVGAQCDKLAMAVGQKLNCQHLQQLMCHRKIFQRPETRKKFQWAEPLLI